MSLENCLELFLEDIVSVAAYDSDDMALPYPPSVAGSASISNLPVKGGSKPVFKAAIDPAEGSVLMSESPTLKITNSRSAAGNVYTHELSVPVLIGRELAESIVTQLQGSDFYMVYYRANGTCAVSYSLPNTAIADIEESLSSSTTVSLKIKLQSCSQLINIG